MVHITMSPMPAFSAHPPLVFDESGTPTSTLYGDVFRSRHGAVDEAREVFVEGCELPARWEASEPSPDGHRRPFPVLELGFGAGVNFLVTLAEWRAAAPQCAYRLHFVSVEAHPLSVDDLHEAHEAFGVDGADAQRLRARWPRAMPGLHVISFDDADVTLTLCFGAAEAMVRKLRLAAEAFFLDGFAPARNPAMWEPHLMRALARLARPGATLATWTAAASVREALSSAGFAVERIAGHGGKRHRLRARYAPRWRTFEPPPAPPRWPVRTAIVVGAGLAGAAVAAGFARRGWQVTVLEAGATACSGGSAQPLCVDHLHLSPDDNVLARLTRAGLGLRSRTGAGGHAPIGKLVVDTDDGDCERSAAMLERLHFPESFARRLDATAASDVAGIRLARGALWIPDCEVLDPRSAIDTWLGAATVQVRTACPVRTLRREDDGWTALDALGRPLARASIVVLANAGDAVRLGEMRSLPIRAMRGQSTWLPRACIGPLRTALGGDAWAVPAGERILVGATFEADARMLLSREADLGNLRRLARGIGGDAHAWLAQAQFASLGLRVATTDRLPAIGSIADEAAIERDAEALVRNERLPLPRRDGLYAAFAFGSRGLLWAALAAELLPAMAEGSPLPLESDLVRSIDPARFVRRRLRAGAARAR